MRYFCLTVKPALHVYPTPAPLQLQFKRLDPLKPEHSGLFRQPLLGTDATITAPYTVNPTLSLNAVAVEIRTSRSCHQWNQWRPRKLQVSAKFATSYNFIFAPKWLWCLYQRLTLYFSQPIKARSQRVPLSEPKILLHRASLSFDHSGPCTGPWMCSVCPWMCSVYKNFGNRIKNTLFHFEKSFCAKLEVEVKLHKLRFILNFVQERKFWKPHSKARSWSQVA